MNFFNVDHPVVEFVMNAAIVVIVLFATLIVARVIRRSFLRAVENPDNNLNFSVRQYSFLSHLMAAIVYITGFSLAVYLIPPIRHLSVSLFAGSGILAIIIGFASQVSIANIVSGVFITIFKPFVVGDRVKLLSKDVGGVVEDITLRHTVIRTFENKRIVIPNSIISTEMVENSNMTDEKICRFVEIGISYDSDVDKAMRLMREEAEKHADMIDNRTQEEKKQGIPAVLVRVVGFGDSSVNLRANVWARDQATAFQMGCDLNKAIKQRFDLEGIEIPYPYRTIVYKDKPVHPETRIS